MRAVLVDLHHTLVVARSMDDWLHDADAATTHLPGARLARVRRELPRVWDHVGQAQEPGSWDLDPQLHRSAFVDALERAADAPRDLGEQLYATLTDQWQVQDGAVEFLGTLREGGLKTALVSNIALDPRPALERLGVARYLDELVLSAEVGLVKPDPAIFRLALDRLGVLPGEALMVGDSPHDDGGAVDAGIATFLLPRCVDGEGLVDASNGLRTGLAAATRLLLDGVRNS